MSQDFKYQFYLTSQEAWNAMYEAILEAKKSIYWEVFIFVDDEIGKKFVAALKQKSEEGVDVKIILDAVGSYEFSSRSEENLKKSGVDILRYNRLYPSLNVFYWYWRIISRNHRKVLIVDEEIAFLGGVNVKSNFKDWGDLYMRLQGKVVRPLLRAFAKSYISSGGSKEKVQFLLHRKRAEWREWRKKFTFLIHSPRYQNFSRTTRWYVRALTMAQETVHLVTPYFVPDKRFLKALAEAKARGVKVNVYLPLRPDHKVMELLGRAYYRMAERAGAHIYFLPEMNHSKAMSVDDKFGMVGSANVTRRSSWLDAETSVMFEDEAMVKELNSIFNGLKTKSTRFSEAQLPKLGPLERFQQWVLRKVESYF